MVLIGGRARISSGDGPLPDQSQNTVALGDADGSRSEDRPVVDIRRTADTHAANTHADDGPDRGYDSRRTRPRELETMSDRELFAAVSAGQADAMAVLARRHEKSIRFAISRWVDLPGGRRRSVAGHAVQGSTRGHDVSRALCPGHVAPPDRGEYGEGLSPSTGECSDGRS